MKNDFGLQYFLFLAFFSTIYSCEKSVDSIIKAEKESAQLTFKETKDSLFIYWKDPSNAHLSFSKIELPIEHCIIVNPSALPFLSALNKTNKILGIRGAETIYAPHILDSMKKERIEDLGTYQNTEIESIINLKPDLVIASASNDHFKHLGVLSKFGIKVMHFNDFEESEPLNRSAYIKIFGRLFDEPAKGDSIYEEVERNYKEIKDKVAELKYRPTVFINSIYGDSWYMPGRESSIAKYLKDAGAHFIWENQKGNSLPLSFETVFKEAEKADIWLNASNFQSLQALGKADHRYQWFSSFENGEVYNPIKRKNTLGNNDIFETAILRADRLLQDFATILHPDLFPDHELYFYKKLE